MTVTIQLTTSFSFLRKAGAYAYILNSPQGRIRLCGPIRKVIAESDVAAYGLGKALYSIYRGPFTGISRIRLYPAGVIRGILERPSVPATTSDLFCGLMLKKIREKYPQVVVEFREDPAGEAWGEVKVREIIRKLVKNQ